MLGSFAEVLAAEDTRFYGRNNCPGNLNTGAAERLHVLVQEAVVGHVEAVVGFAASIVDMADYVAHAYGVGSWAGSARDQCALDWER